MDDQSLIGDGKTIVEMISGQVPKLIRDQFDRPSNVHGKTGPKFYKQITLQLMSSCREASVTFLCVYRSEMCLTFSVERSVSS